MKNRRFGIAILACMVIAGCANRATTPKPYDASLSTDGSLNCASISTEVERTNQAMRDTAQEFAEIERHNAIAAIRELAVGGFTRPGIDGPFTRTDKDPTPVVFKLKRFAARNTLLANLAATKDCAPVQALTNDGALYEHGSYRPELDKFTDPGDEQIIAPKPRMYVVVGDHPIPSIALTPAAEPSLGSSSIDKTAPRSSPIHRSSENGATTKVSKKELMRQFLKGEITQAEYLKRRKHN